LQAQAHQFALKDNFYVSDLYKKPQMGDPQAQIGMTLGVPVLDDSHVSGTLTADVEMGHLMSVIQNQDTDMGTSTKLVGMDGHNEMLGKGAAEAKGGIQAQQLNTKSAKARVDGTAWSVHVTSLQDRGVRHTHTVPDEVLVRFKRDLTQAEIDQAIIDTKGLLVRKNSRHAYIFRSYKVPQASLVQYFKKHGAVISEPHTRVVKNDATDTGPAVDAPNDVFYGTNQWNLTQISADQAWQTTTGSSNVTIAVVDTGVDLAHPDFKGKLVSGMNMLDHSKPPQDDNGHGTHCAGVIAARTNNVEGIAGINWASKIMPVKAMGADGSGSVVDIADGVVWATDHGANVINLSLGEYEKSDYLHEAITYAHGKGVVICAAMGNDGVSKPSYPAAYPEVVAVAADDDTTETASFSNYGPHCSVTAPGVAIPSTYPNRRYVALSGTSMASPHVAGVAGLIKSINPNLSADDVRDIIQKTADDLGPSGKDDYFGYGQINVAKAVQAAQATLK
jgi:thermitase